MGEVARKRLARAWRDWLRSVLVIIIAITAFRSAVADWNDVPTGSMKPTILEGDRILVNKLAYDLKIPYTRWQLIRWDNPKRGDIVVLFSPNDGKRLVKRVIGLPHDSVAVVDGALVVNGQPTRYSPLRPGMVTDLDLEEPPPILATEELGDTPHAVMISPRSPWHGSFESVTVPEGHYFVMGDNRDHSLDSRYFGPVARQRIMGRATTVAASVDPEHYFLPRWKRFLKALQ